MIYQFSSVTQLCPTVCNSMDCSMPGFPVHRQLPELAQTHVHWVSDAFQPLHPLSSTSPPAFSLSQYQDIFQWGSSLHQVAKVLVFQLQHQSFQWIFRTYFLWYGLVGSPYSPRDSQESSPTSQFKSINSSALSFLYGPAVTSIHDYWKNHSFAAAAKSLQSCLTLCDPMNHSMLGLPVHHHLPEFTQTHVHRVGDAIQPSHPLSSPSPPAPNPSQHQSLFQ